MAFVFFDKEPVVSLTTMRMSGWGGYPFGPWAASAGSLLSMPCRYDTSGEPRQSNCS